MCAEAQKKKISRGFFLLKHKPHSSPTWDQRDTEEHKRNKGMEMGRSMAPAVFLWEARPAQRMECSTEICCLFMEGGQENLSLFSISSGPSPSPPPPFNPSDWFPAVSEEMISSWSLIWQIFFFLFFINVVAQHLVISFLVVFTLYHSVLRFNSSI